MIAIGACGAFVAGLSLLSPYLPSPGAAVAAIGAFVLVTVEVIAVAWRAPRLHPRWLLGLLAPFGLIVALALAGTAVPAWLAATCVTVGLLALGTLVGAVVGNAIDEAGYIVVVAVVSALVDSYSVLHPEGPTAQIVEIEVAVNVLLLPMPILGTGEIAPLLGVGDVAFAAIYMVASRRHGLSLARTAVAIGVGLLGTLAIVIATGRGIPALPLMGLAVVIAQPKARALPRKDWVRAAVGIGVLVLAIVALVLTR